MIRLLPAVALMVVLGCGDTAAHGPRALPPADGMARIQDSSGDFSIVPPAGYRPQDHRHHMLAYLGPQEGDFTVNFNVTARDSNTPVSEVPAGVRRVLPWLLGEWSLVEDGFVLIAGRQCYWLSSTFRWQGRQVRNLQYYLNGRSNLYVVTFAAPAESFDHHRPSFEAAAMSMRAGGAGE
jgi:hypothetical protein